MSALLENEASSSSMEKLAPVPSSLLYSIDDLKRFSGNFRNELARACNGQESSLSNNAHDIPSFSHVKEGEYFQAFVVGGTNYKTALMQRTGEGANLLDVSRCVIGPSATDVDIITLITASIDPRSTVVGLNFAFPMKPVDRDGVLDGILLGATKERKFKKYIGQEIGKVIEDEIVRIHGRKIKVTVANDTACLAIAGIEGDNANKIAAGVVGTGLNFAISHQGKIINLESANFDKFEQTETGRQINRESKAKNKALFEKEVSAGYLYLHLKKILESEGEDASHITSTEDVSIIASANDGSKASEYANTLLERSASLVAVQIVAIYEFMEQPQITMVMEGSLFTKSPRYRSHVERYLKELGVPENGVMFQSYQESDLLGAAKLAAIEETTMSFPETVPMEEIESRFLLSDIPEDLQSAIRCGKIEQMQQGYLSSSERIRKVIYEGGLTLYTIVDKKPVPGKPDYVKDDEPMVIGRDEFMRKWKLIKGYPIFKTRFLLDNSAVEPHKGKIVIDSFEGKFNDINLIEVEFESLEDCDSFVPLSWFGPEVTQTVSSSKLAHNNARVPQL